ncbi:MAG: DUF1778 domain-containing protein [Blastocatellia bacterium]|nr:DUF1778 domain-containing protein [Blastocatellia bacterium]
MPKKAVKPQKPQKSKESRLAIRTSAQVKKILVQAARVRQTNVSQFVLQASLDAAHAVLADQTEFRLTPGQWKAFCERLDAPARVIPALRDLFSEAKGLNE